MTKMLSINPIEKWVDTNRQIMGEENTKRYALKQQPKNKTFVGRVWQIDKN